MERRCPGESAAHRDGDEPRVVSGPGRVPATAGSTHRAGPYGDGQMAVRRTERDEVTLVQQAAGGGDEFGDRGHAPQRAERRRRERGTTAPLGMTRPRESLGASTDSRPRPPRSATPASRLATGRDAGRSASAAARGRSCRHGAGATKDTGRHGTGRRGGGGPERRRRRCRSGADAGAGAGAAPAPDRAVRGRVRPRPGGGYAPSSCSARYARSPASGMRCWAMVSRSRTVTASSSSESKSTVTQNGVPISSCRR